MTDFKVGDELINKLNLQRSLRITAVGKYSSLVIWNGDNHEGQISNTILKNFWKKKPEQTFQFFNVYKVADWNTHHSGVWCNSINEAMEARAPSIRKPSGIVKVVFENDEIVSTEFIPDSKK